MRALRFEKGETVTLNYQVKDRVTGQPKDITGMTFKFAAKENFTDTGYKIAVVTGAIDDAANGLFHITVTIPDTPFSGVYSVLMEDASSKRTVLSSAGGDPIRVLENLID